ncbi:MAG: quinone oxidoreductase [Roseiarcus sp.]|jgi:NADPH2:quinone reductase
MRAIRIHQTGAPDVMRLEDIELPPPGPGEARVRHRAIGVNYLDVYYRSGFYPPPPRPFTPGNEGAGEIVAVGKGVKDFKPGDRVAYASTLGSYAEERNVIVKHLVKLPKAISYETAAAMMLKGLTAQYLLRQTYKVKAGDTILVHAAAGGVGQILCQWGKALGATVIGTVGSAEKAKLAKKAGAKHVILYREEDFAVRVGELTKGAKCHVVYDGVGKATFPASLDCLRPFGMFASYGSASGGIEAFNIALLSQKGSLFVTRPTLFTFLAERERLDKMARDLFAVVASGDVKIGVTARAPLADAARVHAALEARQTTASTVLVP